VIVRDAAAGDLPAVLALLREDVIREVDESALEVDVYRPAFEEILAADHLLLLVGEEDGEIVATAQVTWLRHLSYGGRLKCHVESVRVRSDLRGGGRGRLLMRHIVGLARARGAARIELTTNRRRARAHDFYTSLGFVPSHIGMKLYLGGEA
jgi:GNAT superfamily N-acetyltransferase